MGKKHKPGRKPVEPSERAILVGFYTKQKNVDRIGGIQSAREYSKKKFEEYFDAPETHPNY